MSGINCSRHKRPIGKHKPKSLAIMRIYNQKYKSLYGGVRKPKSLAVSRAHSRTLQSKIKKAFSLIEIMAAPKGNTYINPMRHSFPEMNEFRNSLKRPIPQQQSFS